MGGLALRHLLLIKHSLPQIDESLPAKQWQLSETGRARCEPLARAVAAYAPDVVISSREPKARETAELLAGQLGQTFLLADNLHEHERDGLPFLSASEFQENVRLFFEKPGELVMGSETADQAHQRFEQAVLKALDSHPKESLALVAHGTVISLFVSRRVGLEAFSLWRRLGLPAMIILSLPGFELVNIMESVE